MSCLYLRGAWRCLSAAALLATTFIGVGPALADSGNATVGWLNAPPIKVESDGSKYTQVDAAAAPIQGGVFVNVDAGISGRVKNWTAWPRLGLGPNDWHSFKDYGHSQSYSLPRPKTVADGYSFFIPRNNYAYFMISVCNAHADELRQQGISEIQIFAQSRQIEIAVSASLKYETTGLAGQPVPEGIESWAEQLKVTLSCQRHEALDVPTGAIKGSNLEVGVAQVDSATGTCALGLRGLIATFQPNRAVSFFYVDSDGRKSDLKTIVTDANGLAEFTHAYPLEPGVQSGKLQMVGQAPPFLSNWADFEADCTLPPQGEATALEVHATGDDVMRGGFACPAKVKIWGVVKGDGPVDGHVALAADGAPKALEPYNIGAGETVVVAGDHALSWGPTQTQQNVKFAMYVTNQQGVVVDQLEQTEVFVCRQVTSDAAQGAAGGLAPGKPAPTQSQQSAAGRLVLPQTFAIQAPKGLVRQGQIRLSGGTANAKYKLTFLRKNGGGYVAVNAAQLPKQMTGLVANFPLQALAGGRDWRLQVCPAGGGANACKTADFRLTRIGAGAGAKASTPAPEQPQGTVFIFPGAAN